MTQPRSNFMFSVIVLVFLLTACSLVQPNPVPTQPTVTSTTQVTLQPTATKEPTAIPPTNTPLPTQTETVTPTSSLPTPTSSQTNVPPTVTAVPVIPDLQTGFSCDIIDQSPNDDKEFRSGASFDIKWTIINNGSTRWRDNTILKYQSGPKMTSITKIVLPRLKPDETYEVALDATASGKSGRQVMVWAVIGPDNDGEAAYWMCYPYTRIIIK